MLPTSNVLEIQDARLTGMPGQCFTEHSLLGRTDPCHEPESAMQRKRHGYDASFVHRSFCDVAHSFPMCHKTFSAT